jgi:hypothetical protein
VTRDLRTRLLYSNARSEIDAQLDRRLASLREWFGGKDGTDTDIDGEELIERDRRRGGGAWVVHEVHVAWCPTPAGQSSVLDALRGCCAVQRVRAVGTRLRAALYFSPAGLVGTGSGPDP